MKLNTMALVSCPECQHEVSSLALACPQCAHPYPGKQGVSEEKLQACADCGGVISKRAQLCPHCGVSCTNASENNPVREDFKDESWLCTHCGTPYTRKVRIPAEGIQNAETQRSDHQKLPVTEKQEIRKSSGRTQRAENPQSNDLQPPSTAEQEISFLQKMGAAAPSASRHSAGRHASPLWFPSPPSQDQASVSSGSRKKITIIVGLVIVLLVFLSIFMWVLWEPNGTNPFDGLSISGWSMTNEPATLSQETP